MSLCDRASAFVDGALAESEAEEFRLHLADCRTCQEEIEAALVLSVLDERADVGSLSSEVKRSWWRQRRLLWLTVPAVAAAALLVYLVGRTSPSSMDGAAVARRFHDALRPSRSIEARFSYAGADAYRQYDVPLGTGARVEDIPPGVIAELEAADERSGLVAAYALIGATERATMTLDALPENAASLSDRAALAIAGQKYRQAIRSAARAIDMDSSYLPAVWNRAVALSRLGLVLAAADGFDAVAAAREPGWADEARERAADLRQGYAEEKKHWDRADEACHRLTSKYEMPPPDVLRSYPGLMRRYFYLAASTVTSATDLDKLAPLAEKLDAHYGGRVLAADLERLSRSRWRGRAKLAGRVAARLRRGRHDPTLAGDAIDADQPDIALTALFFLPSLDESQRRLYFRLARESKDPWLGIEAIERALRSQVRSGRGLSNIQEGLGALRRCRGAGFEYRCVRLEYWIAAAFAFGARADAARHHAEAGWAAARRIGDWTMEHRFLSLFANLADLENDAGADLPVMRAYLEESVKRWPGCANARHAALTLASALIKHRDLSRAREALDDLDARCPSEKATLFRLELDAHLVEGSRERSDQVIATLNERGDDAPAAYVASIEGRALATVDPRRAAARLREAIDLARGSPAGFDVDAARRSSFALAAVLAGRSGDFGSTIDLLAEEVGIAPEPCSIGIVDDMGVVIAARDESGDTIGTTRETRPDELLRRGSVVPPALVDHLAGCAVIDVFARPPFLGQPVLPAGLVWEFRERRRTADRPGRRQRYLLVDEVEAPKELGLPALAPSPPSQADVELRGATATPGKVSSELETATLVEIHAHGIVGAAGRGNTSLILSPDASGEFMLTAAKIADLSMRGAPLVLLSACQGAVTSSHPRGGRSLPAAFLEAGASSVVASPDPISDREAYAFFAAIRRRVAGGETVAEAVRNERAANAAHEQWSNNVVVFR